MQRSISKSYGMKKKTVEAIKMVRTNIDHVPNIYVNSNCLIFFFYESIIISN